MVVNYKLKSNPFVQALASGFLSTNSFQTKMTHFPEKVFCPEIQKQLIDFYSKNKPILPPHPNFRQYRFRLWNGTFIKIRDVINTPEKLQRYCLYYLPKDVYYTTSQFLNSPQVGPKNIRRRAGYKWAQNLFISSDFYVDVDEDNPAELFKILETMKSELHLNDYKIVKTGRGWHLHFYDFNKVPEVLNLMKSENPKIREELMGRVKALISNLLKTKYEFYFDIAVSEDTRRIIRVINTMHGGTMTVCREVHEDELKGLATLQMLKGDHK